LRAQVSACTQLTNVQLAQIKALENRLLQSNELLKTANQAQLQLEQQLRDLRLTSEKHQMSMQARIDAFIKQVSQQDNQINASESAKSLLKEELDSVTADNQSLLERSKEDKQLIKDLQQRIAAMDQERQMQNEEVTWRVWFVGT
jgi:chromosome segregation ATPase